MCTILTLLGKCFVLFGLVKGLPNLSVWNLSNFLLLNDQVLVSWRNRTDGRTGALVERVRRWSAQGFLLRGVWDDIARHVTFRLPRESPAASQHQQEQQTTSAEEGKCHNNLHAS